MQQIASQIYLYLFSFWFTIIPSLVNLGYQLLVGEILYGLLIFANCISALQGFIMTVVYFALQKRSIHIAESAPSPRPGVVDEENSVGDIRASGAKLTENS